jgi:aspartyl-tRNA(Asn)/glutamyl-tRNA(Gln) amidotransferase subunit B
MHLKWRAKMSEYKPTIGLEIHVQLATKTKIFCSCSTEFGAEPNTNVCPVCLGMPGTLPVLNEKVVEYGTKLGLALNMTINKTSTFYRKNYFYPDLPKGYQITQYPVPIASEGFLEINTSRGKKKIRILRGHIEEDSGKSIHAGDITESDYSYIDFNRAGVPLMEIVTYPDIETAEEAYEFLVLLRKTVRYLKVSSGDMEKGALRCDVNISVSKDNELGTKVEIKNLNSFRSVRRALEFEINRQIETLKNGGKINQETRHLDERTGETKPMRAKEELNDYRYFPEPDLPPLILSNEYIEKIRKSLPELPGEKEERFLREYQLNKEYAHEICSSFEVAEYFENAAKLTSKPKEVANYLMVNISGYINEKGIGISDIKFPPEYFKELFELTDNGTISKNIAKTVIEESLKSGKSPAQIVEEKGLKQITDTGAIEQMIEEVIKENPKPVSQFLNGKSQVMGFLIGQVMKKTKGKANPKVVSKKLIEKLNSLK